MDWPLTYIEAQFSPGEAAECTGLSLTLQRDWRSLGHLPPAGSGHARFGSREIVEMRTMVVLRNLRLGLAECRAAAVKTARSLLFLMLADHPACLAVDAAPERAGRYLNALGFERHRRHLQTLSGAGRTRFLFILLEGERVELLPDVTADQFDRQTEGATIVKLEVVASNLAEKIIRPLFTLGVPLDFE